eukprot:gene7358-biopygen13573
MRLGAGLDAGRCGDDAVAFRIGCGLQGCPKTVIGKLDLPSASSRPIRAPGPRTGWGRTRGAMRGFVHQNRPRNSRPLPLPRVARGNRKVARAWRGHGAGISCSPRLPECNNGALPKSTLESAVGEMWGNPGVPVGVDGLEGYSHLSNQWEQGGGGTRKIPVHARHGRANDTDDIRE